MQHTQADLERARHHVEDAEHRIRKQRRLINRLKRERLPTREAGELLRQMEGVLDQMRKHLGQITRDVEPDAPVPPLGRDGP